jgi:hypothetical protein
MKICLYKTSILAFILLLHAAAVAGDENSKAGLSWEDYKIISTRNIFSRNRMPANIPSFTESRPIPEREVKEETYLILRGITKKAGQFNAFFEDSRTNRIKQILKGEDIGNGKITDITIDFVTYKLGDNTIKVKTGMSLEGQAAGMMPARSSGFGFPSQQNFTNVSSGPQTDVKTTPQSEDSNAILQRLKERRKKELGE